jgi:hypothetical protein
VRGKNEEEERKKKAEEDEENKYDISSFLRETRKWKPKGLKGGPVRRGTTFIKLQVSGKQAPLKKAST